MLKVVDLNVQHRIVAQDDNSADRRSASATSRRTRGRLSSGSRRPPPPTGPGRPGGAYILDLRVEPAPRFVVGRHVFYNGRPSPAAPRPRAGTSASSSPPISRRCSRAGATFANVTSYDRGITGIVIDMAALPLLNGETPNATDFLVRTGTTPDPATWHTVTSGYAVSTHTGGGEDVGTASRSLSRTAASATRGSR